jgi:type IV secretory pathway protease TraF
VQEYAKVNRSLITLIMMAGATARDHGGAAANAVDVERVGERAGRVVSSAQGKLMLNDLVIAMPPEPLATFLVDGGYLARGVPLIKRILALSGQTVCRRALTKIY